MPPANSRADSPLPLASNLESHPEYLSTLRQNLRQLESIPVPDLASTLRPFHSGESELEQLQRLHSHLTDPDEADEANNENVSFLRSGTPLALEAQEEWRAENAERERERQLGRELGRLLGRDTERWWMRATSRRGTGAEAEARPESATDSGSERSERLMRLLHRLNGIHESASPFPSSSPSAAGQGSYGERNNRENSLYDWSPASPHRRDEQSRRAQTRASDEGRDGNAADVQEELRIFAQLRRERPDISPSVHRAMAQHRAQESSMNRRSPSSSISRVGNSNSAASQTETSLRAQTLAQSVRRHPRFPARSREYMQRYIMDRERLSQDPDERDRWHESRARIANAAAQWRSSYSSGANDGARGAAGAARSPGGEADSTFESRLSSGRAAAEGERSSFNGQREDEASRILYWRRYFTESSGGSRGIDRTPEPTLWLQDAIAYLAKLRYCFDAEDALSHAADARLVPKGFPEDGPDDFLLDLEQIPRPAPTSWLAPGAVFEGSQQATNAYPWPVTRARDASNRETGYSSTYRSWILDSGSADSLSDTRRLTQSRIARTAAESNGSNSTGQTKPNGTPDKWPVKVTIHSVDYDSMTIAATMEAYNVPSFNAASLNGIISSANAAGSTSGPDASPNAKTSSITTYLEGEILDLTNHTFLTESYPSHRATDATYWRKLEPFAHLRSDDDMVGTLVSQRRMTELGEKYVLMRWKERCFIPKSETGGLGSAGPRSPASMAAASFFAAAAAAAAGSAQQQQQPQQQQRGEPSSGGARRPWMNSGDGVMAETGEGCGLTISGFYYVALRRSDGCVEGLYCDPDSSPYQHLKLNRLGGGFFPTWGFR